MLALAGVLGLCTAAWQLRLAVQLKEPAVALGAALTLLPALLAAAALRFRWQVREDGLLVTSLRGSRHCAWGDVRGLDWLRATFVVVTPSGAWRPVWVAPATREELARLIVERAGLGQVFGDLPWGIRARFVPRQHIVPVSHVQRRQKPPDRP